MNAVHRAVTFLVVMLAAAVVVPGVRAQSPGPAAGGGRDRVTQGTLWLTSNGQAPAIPAPLVTTDVELKVTGVVVRATVRQQFSNPGMVWAEGVYVFPLPDDAAVDHLRMRVGDRVIEGVIKERAAAKKTYDAAKQEGRRTSLVEQERPNVFTTSVANIAPGSEISVEIEYQHVLRFVDGELRLRFPMVVGPRYVPVSGVADATRITPPVRHPALGPINPVTIQVELAAGVPLARLESPYHRITSTALGADRYLITLAEGAVPADRDFELVWAPVAAATPSAVVLSETKDGRAFGLVMLVPPAASAEGRRIAREAIFVIDTSGSMAGASIEQARAALKLALTRLQPGDTFNVIQFNSVTDSVFPAPQPASAGNLYLAGRYVDGLRAQGGTEMLPPLMQAREARERHGRLRQVVFLTDGQVGNETQLLEVIRERLGESRLFTIGIGSAPNSHFMREAARLGGGTFTFIGSPTEVQQKMEALFRKIDTPALTDVQIEFPGAAPAETFPARIPDLYIGEPIVVSLRADALPPRAIVRGRIGDTRWTQDVWLQDADDQAGLSVQWARAKIAALLDGLRPGTNDDEVRASVIEVALEHHLVSPYTSLVAVDLKPVRRPDEALLGHEIETNLPDGSEIDVDQLGQGATDAGRHIALGLIALMLAASVAVAARLARLARPVPPMPSVRPGSR